MKQSKLKIRHKPAGFMHHWLNPAFCIRKALAYGYRLLLGLFIVSFLIGLLAYGLVNTFVDYEDISHYLIKMVEEETGGRLEVEGGNFTLLKGLTLNNIRYHPPIVMDQGISPGGAVEPLHPLLEIDAVNIHYNLFYLLLLDFRVHAIQLVNPKIQLHMKDGKSTLDAIADYRKRKNLEKEQEIEQVEVAQDSGQFSLPLPFNPKGLFSPLRVHIRNVGIKNLSVTFTEEQKNQIVNELSVSGVSFDIGASWIWRKSRLHVALQSDDLKPLIVQIKRKSLNQDIWQKLDLQSNMKIEMAIEDFERLSFSTDIDLENGNYNGVNLKPLALDGNIHLSTKDDLSGVNINEIEIKLAESFMFHGDGSVSFDHSKPMIIDLDLRKNARLDFESLSKMIKQFMPNFASAGNLEVESFTIKGPINLEALNLEEIYPMVKVNAKINDVSVVWPENRIDLKGLDGDVKLALSPSQESTASTLESSIRLGLQSIRLNLEEVDDTFLTISNLGFLIEAKGDPLKRDFPLIKASLGTNDVSLFSSVFPTVTLPVDFQFDGKYFDDPNRFTAKFSLELGELSKILADISCENKCQSVQINQTTNISSLTKLTDFVRPISHYLKLAEFFPDKLSGAINSDITLEGTLSQDLSGNFDHIIQHSDLKFKSDLDISKLDLKSKMNDLELDEFNIKLTSNGDLRSQKISLKNVSDRISLTLPSEDGKKKIELLEAALAIDIENSSFLGEGLADLMKNLDTNLKTEIHFGSIKTSFFPQEIRDVGFQARIIQEKMSKIQIKDTVATLNGLNLSIGLNALANIDKDFQPRDVDVNVNIDLKQKDMTQLIAGISTSGVISINSSFSSQDMRRFLLEGSTNFEDFHARVKGELDDQSPLFVVENLRGRIPFRQWIDRNDERGENPEASLVSSHVQTNGTSADRTEDGLAVENRANFHLINLIDLHLDENLSDKGKSRSLSNIDYGSVRPFYQERSPIYIEKISGMNLNLSQIEFDVEIKQNWLALNQFSMAFLGGGVRGEVQIGFEALPKNLRTSIHMTRLNSHRLIDNFPKLKGKKRFNLLSSDPFIDATLHLDFDFVSKDMAGGLEITSIGREQLSMILYYIDPDQENPTISDIQTALSFGDLNNVSVPIKNGEIDLVVDVDLMGIPLPIPSLSKFPISQIIANFNNSGS
jgi:hypothetical protein